MKDNKEHQRQRATENINMIKIILGKFRDIQVHVVHVVLGCWMMQHKQLHFLDPYIFFPVFLLNGSERHPFLVVSFYIAKRSVDCSLQHT